MNARVWGFAWRSLARQPNRAVLGLLGIAAVGALLFDMLLLSRGLVVSFRELLDSAGFDVRVLASDSPVVTGPRIGGASTAVAALAALPEVDEVVPVRFGAARAAAPDGERLEVFLTGAPALTRRRPWVLLEGGDLDAPGPGARPLVINRNLARRLGLAPGKAVTLEGDCTREPRPAPPVRFEVAGIAAFPFDDPAALTAATTPALFERACGFEKEDAADILLVASREGGGSMAAVSAIRARRPDLHAFSNDEIVARFQQVGFSYFRQISAVLSSITLFFGFLLITVLLTVSVNQRFAEIAALRALGFTRRRVVLDVFAQAVLLVGLGGLLSLPLGWALSRWLERILHAMPEIPEGMHFFVFEGRALAVHGLLLALTAVLAAVYPMRLVARLPIAATLRSEVVS
ncbi:MAG TPA: ABC transporter permease [Vicinamibacteria bacterium]|nr:ABC transporter permease [Vicinamibacteria bacterium]